MHDFFTSQGDIMKLGLESSSVSGAFLEISTDLIELTFFCIFRRFSFHHWQRISFIDIYCFFSCGTNINSYFSCNIPLPPPQPAVLRYWGWFTSTPLKYFPHLPQSQWILPHFVFISVPSDPQSCWSHPPSLYVDKRLWVWVFCQKPSRNSTACHQDHLVCMTSLQARVTLWNLVWRALQCQEHS